MSARADSVPPSCTSRPLCPPGGARGRQRGGLAGRSRGLSARDLAMNIALPSSTAALRLGPSRSRTRRRSILRPSSISSARPGEGPGCLRPRRAQRPRPRLGATPVAERRVAIFLAYYPNRDGRIANGVGPDTPASTCACSRMRTRGIGSTICLMDGQALIETPLSGRYQRALDPRGSRRAGRAAGSSTPLSSSDYP